MGRADARRDGVVAVGLLVLGASIVVGDLAGAIAAWIVGRGFRWLPLRAVPELLARWAVRVGFVGRVGHPISEGTGAAGGGAPGWLDVVVFTALVVGTSMLAVRFRARAPHRSRRRSPRPRRSSPGPAFWADRRSVAALLERRPRPGRLVIGRFGRALVSVEPNHSVLVVGPTQSGKTSGLVIPALLEWHGPVVATSVKRDLLETTIGHRRQCGDVFVYDPTGASGEVPCSWDPLGGAQEWAGAKRISANLCGVASSGAGNLEDGAFWYSTAEKLLAPLLFAAANTGLGIGEVARWVDLRITEEPIAALRDLEEPAAWQAAVASFDREDRQLSSVYATLETVLAAFSEPGVLARSGPGGIDPASFADACSPTLYLVAPARAQERLAPVFVALLGEVLERFFEGGSDLPSARDGLLVVLDEAANIAPVRDLDVLASTAASHGVQLVTVFQDLSQIEVRYGAKAATVVNNHRAKLLCSGIADPRTLSEMSGLLGDTDVAATSVSEGVGTVTTTHSNERRPLATGDGLRRIEPGNGVLIYGHLPPVRVRLRPWFRDGALRRLSTGVTGCVHFPTVLVGRDTRHRVGARRRKMSRR